MLRGPIQTSRLRRSVIGTRGAKTFGLSVWGVGGIAPMPQIKKVFLLLFLQKKKFLSYL